MDTRQSSGGKPAPAHKTGRTAALPYMRQLDGLRAVACAGVMLPHWLPPNHLLKRLFPFADGVFLFFVLSGYLITRILLGLRENVDERVMSAPSAAGHFFARRALRLFPLYYTVLLASALLGVAGVSETFPWHLFYASNIFYFLRGSFLGPTSHFWTLAVEEQFYLCWAVLMMLLPRRLILPALGAIIVAAPLGSLAAIASGMKLTVILTPSNLDLLGLGALLAVCGEARYRSPLSQSRLAGICLMIGLPLYALSIIVRATLVVPTSQWWSSPWGVLHHASAGCFFVWLVHRASTGFGGVAKLFLENPAVNYFGRISYGVYVLHLLVPVYLAMALRRLGAGDLLGDRPALVWLVLTVALASLSWHGMERPFQRLKRRFSY